MKKPITYESLLAFERTQSGRKPFVDAKGNLILIGCNEHGIPYYRTISSGGIK